MGQKANSVQKWLYALLNFGMYLAKQGVIAYFVFYYVDVKHLPAAWGAAVFGAFSILNAVNSLVFGYLTDRTQTRWGRRIPYLRFLIIPAVIVFILIWSAPFDGREKPTALLVYFAVIATCWASIIVLYSTAYNALFSEMFPTLEERTDVNVYKGVLGTIGLLVGVAIPPLLYTTVGWLWMGIILGSVILIAWLTGSTKLFERENAQNQINKLTVWDDLKQTLSNRAFVVVAIQRTLFEFTGTILSSNTAFYIKYHLQASDSLTALFLGLIFLSVIPSVFFWKKIMGIFKTKLTMMIGSLTSAIAVFSLFWVKEITLAFVLAAAIGFSIAHFFAVGDILVAEVIDDDNKKHQKSREGAIWGNLYFIAGMNMLLASLVFGIVTSLFGYDSAQPVQADTVGMGFRLLVSIIPMIANLLTALVLVFYPIKSEQQITEKVATSIEV